MAFKVVGDVAPEEQIQAQTPLDPIAAMLQKIPGIGPFLSNVQRQTSPKGFYGPGVLAQLLGQIPGVTPQGAYNTLTPALETGADLAGSLALPGATRGARLLGGALMPMLGHLAQGNLSSPGTGLAKGALGGATQGVLEGILAIPKQVGLHRAANTARLDYESRLAQHEASVTDARARDVLEAALETKAHAQQVAQTRAADAAKIREAKLAHRAANAATMQQYDTAQAAKTALDASAKQSHAEQAATGIMDAAKTAIPEWRGLPSTVVGLMDAVLGKGQRLLSDAYDTAMKAAVSTAKGTKFEMPLDDIRKLGAVMEGQVDGPGGVITHGVVDAGNVIEKLTALGKKKDWQLYRRVVDQLSAMELGVDPAARDAYKAGQGVIEAVDASKALTSVQGQSVLNTENLVQAMHRVKNIDILRNRDLGDFFTSPLVEAAKGAPVPTPDLPKPVLEKFVAPLKTPLPEAPTRMPFTPEAPPASPDDLGEILSRELGTRYGRMKLGGALGGLTGLITGMGNPFHLGGATGAGIAAGAAIPDEWITRAPGTEPLLQLLGTLAQAGGSGARTLGSALGPTPAEAVSPQDLEEIIRAQREGRTAADTPDNLQLILGPQADYQP